MRMTAVTFRINRLQDSRHNWNVSLVFFFYFIHFVLLHSIITDNFFRLHPHSGQLQNDHFYFYLFRRVYTQTTKQNKNMKIVVHFSRFWRWLGFFRMLPDASGFWRLLTVALREVLIDNVISDNPFVHHWLVDYMALVTHITHVTHTLHTRYTQGPINSRRWWHQPITRRFFLPSPFSSKFTAFQWTNHKLTLSLYQNTWLKLSTSLLLINANHFVNGLKSEKLGLVD